MTNDFRLDDSNISLQHVYEKSKNYKIVKNDKKNKNCIIFFSGNGLYYPDTMEVFNEKIMLQDRYEWEHVSASEAMKEYFGIMIFVRDVYKTFYVKGINQDISSIDDVLTFLKEKTEGYHVVTCGNSAGGYMAVIAGHFLKAAGIFSFGGQWSIEAVEGYFLQKYASVEKYRKYYNIAKLVNQNICWFYSALNEGDNQQKEILDEGGKEILSFAMASKIHGDLLLFPCYEKVLLLPLSDMKKINKKYFGKLISKRRFARETLHGRQLVETIIDDIVMNHKSLQIITSLGKR